MKKALVLILLLSCRNSEAACGLTVTANNISIDWDLNFTTVAVQVQIDKANEEACDFGIGITKGGGASYATRRAITGSKTISYNLYKQSALTNVIKDVPDISSVNDVVTGGFQTGTNLSQTILYYLEIPYNLATSPSLVGAGTYTDSFTLSLYEGSDPLAFVTAVDDATISLTITVPSMIGISLVDSGGSFQSANTTRNINFGTLSEGIYSQFDVRLRTNAGLSVTFSSENNGKLKHVNPAATSVVPYKFYVNGALLNLSTSSGTPVVGLTAGGQTAISGLAYPVRAVIGTIPSSNLAGNYQDVLTITATTTE